MRSEVRAPVRRRALLRPLPLVAAAFAIAIAACSTTGPTAAPSNRPSNGAVATATAGAPPTLVAPPSPTPDDAAPVVIDSTLLGLLPESVGSTPVEEDVDAAAEAVNDPALDQLATGVDAAVAVDAGNGNLVYALVVKLKPGAFGEEIYRQWRDSYDEGACAGSGGVVGNAEAEIGGRKTYVTSCVATMHTYHLWLSDENVLISASAIGDGRFGEELLKGLRLTP